MVLLFCLPVGIAVYLMIVNPNYLRILVNTKPGVIILSSAAALMVIGFVWMRRIVRLDV